MGLRALYLNKQQKPLAFNDAGEEEASLQAEALKKEEENKLYQEPEARALALKRLGSPVDRPEPYVSRSEVPQRYGAGIPDQQIWDYQKNKATDIGKPLPQERGSAIGGTWVNKPIPLDIPPDNAYTPPEAPERQEGYIPYSLARPDKKMNNSDGMGDASQVRYDSAQTNKWSKPSYDVPPIDYSSATPDGSDASDVRYGSNQDNKWMAGEPPAIAQAVARKRRDPSAFLSEMQSGFIDPYRLHTANMANQMRTAISDASQAVPGVKPLANMDYRQPVMDEIGYRKDVEAQNRQRLQDQMAYMKQLEGEDGTADWTVVDTKTGPIQHNKRTGEVKPLGTYGGATSGPVGKLTHKTDDVFDSNNNIVKQDFWLDESGGLFTYSNGALAKTDPSKVPWAYKNPAAELVAKESENTRKSEQAARDGVSIINLNDKTSIGFKGAAPARVVEQVTASANVSQAYNGLKKDAKFMGLTTRGKSPEENVKKVMELHREMKGAGPKYQAFLKAQAAALNSGVMNEGERENYIANTLGLDKDLFKNPKYTTDQGLQLNAVSAFQLMAASLIGQALTKADIDKMEGNLTEIARKYPELVDPSRARTALADIARNSARAAKTSVQTEALRREGLPQGSASYIKGSFDPEIEEYFGDLFQEEPVDPNNVYNPSPGSIGSVDTPAVNKAQPPVSGNPPVKAPAKPTKKVGQSLKDKVKSKQNSSAPVINTPELKRNIPNLLEKYSKQKSKTNTPISRGRQG